VRRPREDATIAEAVRHPIRVRILEVVNERDMSPIDFLKAGYADFYFGHRPEVSHVAYHFRELAAFGCLVPVALRRARGSVATTYRGVAREELIGDDWAMRSDEEKRHISRTVAQGLIARIDSAMTAQTFDSRDDRHLSWFTMQLDERGWEQATEILGKAFDDLGRVHQDAEARLRESGDTGMTTTAGMLIFESPQPTPPARRPPVD
jgi:hypothetical protein